MLELYWNSSLRWRWHFVVVHSTTLDILFVVFFFTGFWRSVFFTAPNLAKLSDVLMFPSGQRRSGVNIDDRPWHRRSSLLGMPVGIQSFRRGQQFFWSEIPLMFMFLFLVNILILSRFISLSWWFFTGSHWFNQFNPFNQFNLPFSACFERPGRPVVSPVYRRRCQGVRPRRYQDLLWRVFMVALSPK